MMAVQLDAMADRPNQSEGCGGARVLDLAICLILAVTVVGLLLLAL
ncbi:hypothetical protein [Methylobacterium symbioticum]|uniref:Uncharacterized protein n=1 Tax=Methylobacterium symbioticum TaxID=2584084 RepID=A0A509EAG4_9HYPH|nr:hypothetical protein [Methylobacterium symbioticum]VUD70684.1 hypothetical protein MET9862_01257 [Methylobacterium symbioticum]